MGRVLIVVPARYASQRFPGKPLALLRGPDGSARPLVEWSWRAAMRASDLAEVAVATEDERIAEEVERFGGVAVMTSPAARNGTERCAEALDILGAEPELVINLQGDSPLIPRSAVAALIDAWRATRAPVLTPFFACDAGTEAALLADHRAGRVGGTTVVADSAGQALYFSKLPVPFRKAGEPRLKLHVGLYAYTPAALRDYRRWGPAPLEEAEGLEQLRFLERGTPIRLVELPLPSAGFWEVNNPEDLSRVEQALSLHDWNKSGK